MPINKKIKIVIVLLIILVIAIVGYVVLDATGQIVAISDVANKYINPDVITNNNNNVGIALPNVDFNVNFGVSG